MNTKRSPQIRRKEPSYAKDEFSLIWHKFQDSTPKSFRSISMEVSRTIHGPELPEKAFKNLDSLIEWYRSVLYSWLIDALRVIKLWQEKLPTQEHELALRYVAFEARSTGIRRIQRRIFREDDGTPRDIPISSYDELSAWADFIFQLLEDDEQHIENTRQTLTFRYDKGVAYRLEEERKEAEKKYDEFVAASVHSMMKSLSKAKPQVVEPDDEWLLVIWSQLANPKETLREITVSLFVDSQPQAKQPHRLLLEDMIYTTWKAMRSIGPVCRDEPRATNPQKVRQSLDMVKRFCASQEKQRLRNARETMVVSNKIDSNPVSSLLEFEPPAAGPTIGKADHSTHSPVDARFKVAISFPGERQPYVSRVVRALREPLGKDSVFYYPDYKAQLARLNLDTLLQRIYRDRSDLIVVFLCAEYAIKQWCGLEWRAVREIIKSKDDHRLMLVKFDDADVEGVFSIDGFIDAKANTAKQVAEFILMRVREFGDGI